MCRRMEKSQSTSGKGFLYQIITLKHHFEPSEKHIQMTLASITTFEPLSTLSTLSNLSILYFITKE